ncbi:MAG: DnaJ domain-containing protein [Rickettsiales bacterium]|nr:DnaJ domain-containing protein [Rickettsiales bacterium]
MAPRQNPPPASKGFDWRKKMPPKEATPTTQTQSVPDYYAALELPRNADADQIKKAYRNLMKVFHPDKNPDKADDLKELFQCIKEAYEALSNPEKRALYDTALTKRNQRSIHSKDYSTKFPALFKRYDEFRADKEMREEQGKANVEADKIRAAKRAEERARENMQSSTNSVPLVGPFSAPAKPVYSAAAPEPSTALEVVKAKPPSLPKATIMRMMGDRQKFHNWRDKQNEAIDLSEQEFQRDNFSGYNLGEINFSKSRFLESLFNYTLFDSTHLEGATFSDCELDNAHFNLAKATGMRLYNCDASHSEWEGATLIGARMLNVDLSGANLNGIITDQNTQWANITTDEDTIMSAAVLRQILMQDEGLKPESTLPSSALNQLLKNPSEFNAVRRQHPGAITIRNFDFSTIDCTGLDLRDARLERCNLAKADMRETLTNEATTLVACRGSRAGKLSISLLAKAILDRDHSSDGVRLP